MEVFKKQKKYKAGLLFLNSARKKLPARNDQEKGFILSAELLLNVFVKDSITAERIVPELKLALKERNKALLVNANVPAVNNFTALYNPILEFYRHTKQWSKFSAELKFYQSIYSSSMNVQARLCIVMYKYALDSVQHDYLAALKGYQRIRFVKDSLTKIRTDKQINQLDSKLMFAKKEKDINSLNKQAVLHKSELEKSTLQRNITLGGAFVLMVFVCLIYFAYRNKQLSNSNLQTKQEEINLQNNELSSLLNEKEKLLEEKDNLLDRQECLITEKEWLLKEVHHRVKNNLQIINSLLYTQSSYLQNKDAISAIKDSQNRVQAISLIHQRLYSKTNVSTVIMADYIKDLVRFLGDSYDSKSRKIRFREILEHANLDISQAVPLGLILNEAITNSIKYAFDDLGGEITVSGKVNDNNSVHLRITDTGKGLPAGFLLANSSSMGMEMMIALSKQLGGTFEIISVDGVTIAVDFKIKMPVEVLSLD